MKMILLHIIVLKRKKIIFLVVVRLLPYSLQALKPLRFTLFLIGSFLSNN